MTNGRFLGAHMRLSGLLSTASIVLAIACSGAERTATHADAGAHAGAGVGSSAGAGADAQAPRRHGTCGNAQHQLFPPGAVWNTKISDGVDAESDAILGALARNHTDSRRFQIDFSIHVLQAQPGSPRRGFTPNADFYQTDCDPAPVPLPADGALEGETGYACTSDGDCHLIVVDDSACRLYEMWRANITQAGFSGGCLAVWNLDGVPPATLRGEQCTSADAAGLPIAALLFNADEVADGVIPHALRFILPNALIRHATYVRPASHATRAASGAGDTAPYGARFRLKPATDLSQLSPAARIVARALIDYGMYLADGGNLTFTGQSDRFSNHTWDEVGLTPQALKGLTWSDFEMVEGGTRFDWQGDCRRTPIVD